MGFMNPYPPPGMYPMWTTYETHCNHCYCQDDEDTLGITRITPAKKDHLRCCKCSDVRHRKFVLNGGTESDNSKEL